MRNSIALLMIGVLLGMVGRAWAGHPEDAHGWSDEERGVLRSLWIGSLGPLPPDPSNAYADDPGALALGRDLFFETRLSGNMKVSCATCHRPDAQFTDNLPLSHGMGRTSRRSMPLAGIAYSPWLFWDGRKDSLWSQALGPIESPVEHGISRTMSVHILRDHYRAQYEAVFGPMPDFDESYFLDIARPASDNAAAQDAWDAMPHEARDAVNRVYANMGKAIGAYVRHIVPGPSRFDAYVETVLNGASGDASEILSDEEAGGLRLFIGRAGCVNCHNGPLLSNFGFHNVGIADLSGPGSDRGRALAMLEVIGDEFNCLGPYSDAGPDDCAELRFMADDTVSYIGAFKTPSLRGVAGRPPYTHAGTMASLAEVLFHYRELGRDGFSSGEALHGGLSDEELALIEAFLHTLDGPVIAP